MKKSEIKNEFVSTNNPNILRIIPDWRAYFLKYSAILESGTVVLAKGGTVDSYLNRANKLAPIPHPVTIDATEGLTAVEIAKMFTAHAESAETLGELYPWTTQQSEDVPFRKVKVRHAARISSFDSGEEESAHFTAAAYYDKLVLLVANQLIESQGTDTLIKKIVLETITFSRYLVDTGKKIIGKGAAKPGFEKGSDAISTMTTGLYAALEQELPPGAYIISPAVTREGDHVTHILPALGAVKLHTDGYFHSPNSGPILEIKNGTVYIHPLYYLLKKRSLHFSLFPDFSTIYFQDSPGVMRLQKALESVCIETVENSASMLKKHYEDGSRVFIIKARGVGNGPPIWRKKIAELLDYGDTTVIVTTIADSGDVNLKKYAAGLDIPGVLSARTLREEAAWALGGIIHDLKMHNQLPMEPQKLIELFCYLSGMIELPNEEARVYFSENPKPYSIDMFP